VCKTHFFFLVRLVGTDFLGVRLDRYFGVVGLAFLEGNQKNNILNSILMFDTSSLS
tara:strand:- start:10 stop:177 length:168 start_codon:yes stop_codon:yes gene_type:complete